MENTAELNQMTIEIQPQTDTVITHTDAVVVFIPLEFDHLASKQWILSNLLTEGNLPHTPAD